VLPEMQHRVRFVLGLKGTLSEAELFVLRARLQAGILNKARRGALKLVLPIGLCYTESEPLFLTLICRYKPPSRRSFAVLRTPDQLLRQFATFESLTCSFRGGSVVDHTLESWRGQRSSTMMCYGFFTIQLTQGLLSMGVPA
jgi:hypothetical protein